MNLDWLREREKRICSTDAATIVVGVDKFNHPDSVIRAKCRPILFPDREPRVGTYSPQALWGLCLEDAVREWYVRFFETSLCRAVDIHWDGPRELVHDIVVRTDTEIPVGASLDWVKIAPCDRLVIVECKSTKYAAPWKRCLVPPRVKTQIIWQSIATGISEIEVVLMLQGTAPELRPVTITDDDRDSTYDMVERWYQSTLLPAMECAREGLVAAAQYQLATGPLFDSGI